MSSDIYPSSIPAAILEECLSPFPPMLFSSPSIEETGVITIILSRGLVFYVWRFEFVQSLVFHPAGHS
jgi:hypothetical protein